MTTAVQRRRGTATEHSSFTGLEGELSVNTTNESVHVHDGSTAGGFELMRADGSNSSVTLGDISGVTAGTGLSGGGTSGTVTLDIDSTVTTLDGTQTLTNKTLTSPTLNTPTIGTSFTIGGATITEAELEILDGATVTTTELNYVDGVTSSIQTQIDAKAPLASPTFTGTVTMDGLTVDTNTLYVDSTNNRVGVGTSSPAESIHTTGNIRLGDSAPAELYSNSSELRFGVDKNNDNGTSNITFYVDNSEKVRIDSSGNVGIGTSSPNYSLHVNESSDNTVRFQITNSSTGTGVGDGFQIIQNGSAQSNKVNLLNYDNSALGIWTNNTERLHITASGNVGIGNSSPATPLDVKDTASSVTLATFGGSAQTNFNKVDFNSDTLSSQAYIIAYGSGNAESGNIAFKNTNSSGDVFFTAGGVERIRILSTGGITFNGDTAQANALDDYEEGAWTPVADFNGSNTGLTYSNREGHYTKIGRLVVANVRLTLSAEGTSNGEFQVSLPFTIDNIASTTSLYGGGTVPWLQGYAGAAYDVAPVPFEGSNKFRLTYRSSGTASSGYMTRTNTTDNFDIRAQVIYFTT